MSRSSRRFTYFPPNPGREVMEGLPTDRGNEVEDSAELERVIGLVMKAIEGDIRRIAESIVLKRDDELLGPGEFDLRDKVLAAACHILEATVNDRKKGGTKAAARSVPAVAGTPGSSSGEARGS
jgi:hypothetical protein